MRSTGIRQGRPERKPRIEEGLIKEVDLDRGYCVVDTASGRTLDEVRIASPMGGDVGLRVTPMPDTSCLVLYYLPDALQHAYLLSTFRQSSCIVSRITVTHYTSFNANCFVHSTATLTHLSIKSCPRGDKKYTSI
jgi:hypothetical protein